MATWRDICAVLGGHFDHSPAKGPQAGAFLEDGIADGGALATHRTLHGEASTCRRIPRPPALGWHRPQSRSATKACRAR